MDQLTKEVLSCTRDHLGKTLQASATLYRHVALDQSNVVALIVAEARKQLADPAPLVDAVAGCLITRLRQQPYRGWSAALRNIREAHADYFAELLDTQKRQNKLERIQTELVFAEGNAHQEAELASARMRELVLEGLGEALRAVQQALDARLHDIHSALLRDMHTLDAVLNVLQDIVAGGDLEEGLRPRTDWLAKISYGAFVQEAWDTLLRSPLSELGARDPRAVTEALLAETEFAIAVPPLLQDLTPGYINATITALFYTATPASANPLLDAREDIDLAIGRDVVARHVSTVMATAATPVAVEAITTSVSEEDDAVDLFHLALLDMPALGLDAFMDADATFRDRMQGYANTPRPEHQDAQDACYRRFTAARDRFFALPQPAVPVVTPPPTPAPVPVGEE
jgi:hypothetical protein